MNFKTIFVLFNIVLICSFAFITAMPFFMLESEVIQSFWLSNWFLAALFAVLIIGFNAFFIKNWRLFSLLEKESWEPLAVLLRDKIYTQKRYSKRDIRLYVNTLLLLGKIEAIYELESQLRTQKPAMLRQNALIFGAARLLKNDPAANMRFFDEFPSVRGIENPEWFALYRALALVIAKRAPEAAPAMEHAAQSTQPILALMASFILATMCAPALQEPERSRLKAAAENKKKELAALYVTGHKGSERWSRELEQAKSEVHIVILSKIVDDASDWLFSFKATA